MKQKYQKAQRLHISIQGAVQGVGFRPFIYRLAHQFHLKGWVLNGNQGVHIEVEGPVEQMEKFLEKIKLQKPPQALIETMQTEKLPLLGYSDFSIKKSRDTEEKRVLVLPDLATCADCLQDISIPENRRHLYPFTNCTNCGPRYTIIQALPYDRIHTTMADFTMCSACQKEYQNPMDRRFHAQPNCCADCGPHLELWNPGGTILSARHQALLDASQALRNGSILAIKGLGGFHLMVDGRNEKAVNNLRKRKGRPAKPLALMYPCLEEILRDCKISAIEQKLLTSSQAPIVLVRRNPSSQIAPSVAPANPFLGVLLPYTPIHHILLKELAFPLVATSANLSGEPICIEEGTALERLEKIADYFLVHNRPIVQPVDDSVVQVVLDRTLFLRRARGYAPLPISLHNTELMPPQCPSILAVGGHLKNTVALSVGPRIFVSQHIGDLEGKRSFSAFEKTIGSLKGLYETVPKVIACDHHPDYLSTHYAQGQAIPSHAIQHHHSHILATMAEHKLSGPVLGVVWDGTGYGDDATLWGGEFLLSTLDTFERVAHLRTFLLPGGEKAIREPRRTALGILFEIWGDRAFDKGDLAPLQAFTPGELKIFKTMLQKKINSPSTSSMGRLFDGVASLIGLSHHSHFEGQSAMQLQFAIDSKGESPPYPFGLLDSKSPLEIDWEPVILSVIKDFQAGISPSEISARFHSTLSEITVVVAKKMGEKKIILTGGCFQNRYLLEGAVIRLREENFEPYWPEKIPPNDGGIALGQVLGAAQSFRKKGNQPCV